MIQGFDSLYKKGALFLDHHPVLYKTALIICHLFRAIMIYAMLSVAPLLSLGFLIPLSLLYRVSVERFCAIRFTLPSLFGGISMFLTKISPFGLIPLAAYSIMILYSSNKDVTSHLEKRGSCCKK
jgi:hypothetical protein